MLQKVHALEYIMVSPRRFPIPRERAHSFYHLPVRVWRFFYRAWAMTGKKWRKFSKVVLDWFEPQIPLEMLMGISDVEKGGSRRSTDSLHRINLTNRSVRWTGPVPVPAEQLSFQAFESNPVEEMLAANAAKGKAVWDNIVSNPEMRHLLLWGCKPETQPA
jgi:hypothetical protein